MNRLLLLIGMLTVAYTATSQTCTQSLNQAEDDYEAGRLLGIPGQLENCLMSEAFSKEEEIRAKKLLTLVYIFTDQEAKAEIALIKLLKADPEHRLNPQVDPAELFFLYNQYRVKPIFRLSLKVGANSSYPQIIQDYGTQHTERFPAFYNGRTADGETSYAVGDEQFEATNGLGIGYWADLMVERHLKNGLELGFGGQFRISNYNVDVFQHQGLSTSLTNQQVYLRAPLLARYTFGYDNRDKNILPYLFAGGSFDYLLSANYSEATRVGGISFTLGDNDLIAVNQVNQINYSLFGGVGIKLRLKTHFLTFEARYDNSRLNYINGEERMTNQESTFDLAFQESDLSLNFISFSVGYTRSIYSPKKLKEY